MTKYLTILVMMLALTAPLSLVAQEEEAAERYFYVTYFYCHTAKEEAADEAVKKSTKPIYDAAVDDGTILGWGWLAHHTGGKWRRAQYHMSDSIQGLLKSQAALQKRAEEAGAENDGLAESCGSHDDYIWQVETGNGIVSDRANAGLSVYHVCKISKEERADELVEKVFTPVYNKAVEDGKIKSWGWSSHVVGGKYRRLATMTGESFDSLLTARGEILQAIYADGDNAEANEFSDICTSHSDYMWEIVHEKRK